MAMALRLVLLAAFIAGIMATSSTKSCGGMNCPNFDVIDMLGEVELRRYPAGVWLRLPVPNDDFTFIADYGYETLLRYFNGDNYASNVVKQSTPMMITLNLWDKTAPRHVSFLLPSDPEPPAPKAPAFLEEVEESFVYAVTFNDSISSRSIYRNVASTLVDLVQDGEPLPGACPGGKVFLAMYNLPGEEANSSTPNEYHIVLPESELADSMNSRQPSSRSVFLNEDFADFKYN